uniref:Uncharacterized protein n=1 Tax=viral metagenome TaxID=1070528 RepID=A0A6C0LR03_9ZZZZ
MNLLNITYVCYYNKLKVKILSKKNFLQLMILQLNNPISFFSTINRHVNNKLFVNICQSIDIINQYINLITSIVVDLNYKLEDNINDIVNVITSSIDIELLKSIINNMNHGDEQAQNMILESINFAKKLNDLFNDLKIILDNAMSELTCWFTECIEDYYKYHGINIISTLDLAKFSIKNPNKSYYIILGCQQKHLCTQVDILNIKQLINEFLDETFFYLSRHYKFTRKEDQYIINI